MSPGLAKSMLSVYDDIQDKEQMDFSKNQKFSKVLQFLRDLSDDESTKKPVNETRDDEAQRMASTLIDALGTSTTLENLIYAMSTDDAKLYLSAIMRDYDIDNPMDINLDNLEEVGGYDRKGNKIDIPSDKDVKRRKVGIGNALEENKNVMSNIMQYWDRTDTMINDLREFILAAKDAGGDDLVREIADVLKLMTNYALGEYKKLTSLKDIKETIKQMRSINEKSYPFDKCLDDNEKKYGKKGAAKICGSIRAAFGESLEEATSPSDSLKGIEGALTNVASKVNKSISTKTLSDLSKMGTADINLWHDVKLIAKGILDDNDKIKALKALDPDRYLDEGLPKGYFKKEFGIGKKKKKLKEASGPCNNRRH